jgi:hypothetical protein
MKVRPTTKAAPALMPPTIAHNTTRAGAKSRPTIATTMVRATAVDTARRSARPRIKRGISKPPTMPAAWNTNRCHPPATALCPVCFSIVGSQVISK